MPNSTTEMLVAQCLDKTLPDQVALIFTNFSSANNSGDGSATPQELGGQYSTKINDNLLVHSTISATIKADNYLGYL